MGNHFAQADSVSTHVRFLIFYFLNGFLGGVAETGCTMVLTQLNLERKAVIVAAIGTASGVGCMTGPPLGGLLYEVRFMTD